MQKLILAGIVTKAGVVNSATETQDVINFTLLTTDSYTDKAGERQKNSQFHECSMFMPKGKAEHTASLLNKGRSLEMDGKLKTSQPRVGKTREGAEKTFVNKGIIVNNILNWGSKGKDEAAAAA